MIPTRFNPMGIPVYYSKRLSYLAKPQTGNTYINTEYVFDSVSKGSELEIKLYLPSSVTNGNVAFGVRRTATAEDALYALGRRLVMGDSIGAFTTNDVFPVEQPAVLHFSGGKYSIDGGTEVDTGKLPATQYPFGLFTFNSTGYFVTSVIAAAGTRIYYCKFWENGTLVRSFIPVLDKSGVPCMYDTVTKNRFYNAGTGTFDYA